MIVTLGEEGKQILQAAMSLASDRNERFSSLHLLLAFTQSSGLAREVLRTNEVAADRVKPFLRTREMEPASTMDRISEEAKAIVARIPGSRRINPLHLLASVASVPDTFAYRAMSVMGCNPSMVVAQVLGILTGTGRRTFHLEAAADGDRAGAGGAPKQGPRAPDRGEPGQGAARQGSLPPEASGDATDATSAQPARRADRPMAMPSMAPGAQGPWALDPKRYPILHASGANLNELAARGKLDPLFGRRVEIESIMDILGKRRANNPCLVGEPGVGKTAIVEGFASMIVREQVPEQFRGRLVVRLGVSGLVGGTGVRGALGERLTALRDEVGRASGRIILFLDDVQDLIKAAEAGGEGAVQDLKEAMERGALPCICTTTQAEWKRMGDSQPGFARSLTCVPIDEPDEQATQGIVGILSEKYSSFHRVRIEDSAIHAAVTLATRYIPGRRNPEKTLTILDLAAARAARGSRVLDREEVAKVVSEMAGVPRERLSETDTARLLALEDELARRIVGHREAISAVARIMRRNAAGFRGNRPIGSFLFLGPTGVGKTEMSKAMAEVVFSRAQSFVRFDMSEFSEAHSVSRLVGAPPGYVGYDRGGELTGALADSPYKLVLFDEFEKAHPAIHKLLLQVLDDGRLTDATGRTTDFSNTVIVLTSNLGSDVKPQARTGFALPARGGDGFSDYRGRVIAAVRGILPPEFFNRIDEPIVFSPLEDTEIREIARRLLAATARSLESVRGVTLSWGEDLVTHLVESGGFDVTLGARPMVRTIQRLVEAPIAEIILEGRASPGDSIRVKAKAGEGAVFRVQEAHQAGERRRSKERRNGRKKRDEGVEAA